ncbi:FG-GAP repeat domain-containing protein [Planctomycetes bacterium Poly30]
MKFSTLRTSTLALFTLSAASPFALSQELLMQIYGRPADFSQGTGQDALMGVFHVGDLNGDSVDDFVVTGRVGPNSRGFYQVYSGATLSPLNARMSYNQFSFIGDHVEAVGDVNGDGRTNLALSEVIGDHSPIIVDWETGAVVATADSSMSPSATPGQRGAPLGDINGDGYADWASGTESNEGVVIHLGPDARDHAQIYGHGSGGLCSPGDLNGDGIADLVIGSGAYNEIVALSMPSVQVLYTIDGDYDPFFGTERLGASLDAIGDIDGDGIGDFVAGAAFIGAPSLGDSNPHPGAIVLYSGASGEVIRRIPGPVGRAPLTQWGLPADNGSFGTYVQSEGDINGDGYNDILVGSHNRWYFEEKHGAETIVSGKTGEILFDLELMDQQDPLTSNYGLGGAILGDLTGDGLAEFAIVGFGDWTQGFDTGVIHIFKGFRTDAESGCTPTPHSGGVAASFRFDGAISLSRERLWAQVFDAPAHSFGLFFGQPGASDLPAGPHGLCVHGPGAQRITPVVPIDAAGSIDIELDVTGYSGNGTWLAGTQWTLQAIFRDAGSPSGGGTTNSKIVRWAL